MKRAVKHILTTFAVASLSAFMAGSSAFATATGKISSAPTKVTGPMCKIFDRTPSCCPHPPPQCCAPELSTPLDDDSIGKICGATLPKGQASGLNVCNHYFTRGEEIGEVSFGRELGSVASFEKLRTELAGGRSKVSVVTVAGAKQAFLLRQTDELGKLERSSAWAWVGTEIVHIEAERNACDEDQVLRLLARAIERLPASAPPAATGATVTARRPG